jgi:hypothetical protein
VSPINDTPTVPIENLPKKAEQLAHLAKRCKEVTTQIMVLGGCWAFYEKARVRRNFTYDSVTKT